jgi:hypothetical protein
MFMNGMYKEDGPPKESTKGQKQPPARDEKSPMGPVMKRGQTAPRPSSGTTGYQVLNDANGDPMPELFDLIHGFAVDITTALPSPSLWPGIITYLLASMEHNIGPHSSLDSALDNICRLITRRMNRGEWV